jgi:ribonuclease-3
MDESLRSVKPETSLDFKSRLQTELQSQKQKTAVYHLVKTEGPPHSRTFYVEVAWEGGRAKGQGNSIKAAEMRAAAEALNILSASHAKRGAKN